MKENQKILYEHYKSIAENVKKDIGNKDFKQIVRDNAKKHAEEILSSHPEFEVKEKVETKSKEKK